MCLTAKNFGLQEENINISKPQGKTTNYEIGMGYHRKRERERERDTWTERERKGGCSAIMKKEDNSLIDVAHFTYIFVYHTNVSEADNIYKNPSP